VPAADCAVLCTCVREKEGAAGAWNVPECDRLCACDVSESEDAVFNTCAVSESEDAVFNTCAVCAGQHAPLAIPCAWDVSESDRFCAWDVSESEGAVCAGQHSTLAIPCVGA
jgi:hypothetical protein